MTLQRYWSNLENWPDIYSVGQRLSLLGTTWIQHTSDSDEDFDQTFYSFQATVTAPDEEYSISLAGDTDSTIWRILGCWIISSLPEVAVTDAVQELRDIFVFYTNPPKPILPDIVESRPISVRALEVSEG